MFDQLEQLLRANLPAAVTLRGNAEVTAIEQDSDAVRVTYTDRLTGASSVVPARYVLGCDGANSLTREAIGATMRSLDFAQRWLVVDVATDAALGAWPGVHQVCGRQRAATYMRIGSRRHRWEFRLLPGETAEDYRDIGLLHPLISPWTGTVAVEQLELVRVAEYTFRAEVADRWRDRRVFLLGDAAHLTPPFIGQGMGAGLRDAANLTWKLASMLSSELPESALDSYEAERSPHAHTMIRMAKLMGSVMTGGGRWAQMARQTIAPRLHRIPGRLLDSGTPPLRRSSLVREGRLAGRLCPNALLDDGRRFDDVAAGRFAVVTAAALTDEQREAVERRAVVVVARPGSELHTWLRRGRARFAVVRPDGTVLRAGSQLHTWLRRGRPAAGAAAGWTGSGGGL